MYFFNFLDTRIKQKGLFNSNETLSFIKVNTNLNLVLYYVSYSIVDPNPCQPLSFTTHTLRHTHSKNLTLRRPRVPRVFRTVSGKVFNHYSRPRKKKRKGKEQESVVN